ncbi:hypothetical protein DRQ50_14005, partial [bacterium]
WSQATGPTVVNAVRHQYFREQGSSGNEGPLTADTWAEPKVEGTAGPIVSGNEWWWKPSVTVTQLQPEILKWNTVNQEFDPMDWTNPGSDRLAYYQTPANQPDMRTEPQDGGGHIGWFDAEYDLAFGGTQILLRVNFPFEVDSTGDVDNGSIVGWKEGLEATMTSFITTP